MWDTHYHTRKGDTNVLVKVTEQRAATDESINLLNEFQEKAISNIVHRVNIQDNIINGTEIFFRNDVSQDTVTCFVRFKINGSETTIQKTMSHSEFSEKQVVNADVNGKRLQGRWLQEEFTSELAKHLAIFALGAQADR